MDLLREIFSHHISQVMAETMAFVATFSGLGLRQGGFVKTETKPNQSYTVRRRWRKPNTKRRACLCMAEKPENAAEASKVGVASGGEEKPQPSDQTLPRKEEKSSKASKIGGKKSLLKPDGTPYAPWMRVAEGSELKKKPKTDAKGKLAKDPQEGELSGLGMGHKMLGDELELTWKTGKEEGNAGFIVSRRAGQSDQWEQVADYNTAPSQLVSAGSDGGKYSYIVEDVTPGTWIYRISDVDKAGNASDLSQCLVEIQSSDDRKKQTIALAALIGLGVIMLVGGVLLDPLGGVN